LCRQLVTDTAEHGGRLQDLGEGAKALFRFDPRTVDRDDLAWSLIAFAELRAPAWENAYGERIELQAVVRFGLQALQAATQGLKPYAAAGLPLPKKLPIHRFTCGGTHLCYSLVVVAKHGFLQAAGGQPILATGDAQGSERSHPSGPRRRASTPQRPPVDDTGAAPRGYGHGGLDHGARCKRLAFWVGFIIHRPRLPVKAPQLSRHVDRRSRGGLAVPMAVSPAGPWRRGRAMSRMGASPERCVPAAQNGGSGRGRSRPRGEGPGRRHGRAGRQREAQTTEERGVR
jgi:hypothetical protein